MAAQQLVAPAHEKPIEWRDVYQIIGLLNGYADYGKEVTLTSLTSNTAYAQTIRNLGTGGHLVAQRSYDGATVLAVTDTGVTISLALTVATLHVTGNALVDGTLGAGATTVTTLHATAAATLDTTLHVIGASTLDTTLNVTGLATFGALTATGNVALGDANADVHTVIGVTTFRNTTPATQLLVDAGNNRVIVGSSTALGSDTTPNLQVIGRLYVAPDAANDLALQIRRSSAATTGWNIGVTSTNDLVFKDLTTVETFRVGAVASSFQATVTGALKVTTSITATGGISAGASSAFTGGLTVVTGGLTVSGGGAAVTGSISATAGISAGASSAFTGGVSVVTNNLTVSAGRAIAQTFEANGTGAVLVASGTSQYQTTVGAAGGSSALPANPVAYVKCTVAGSSYCFPIYNV